MAITRRSDRREYGLLCPEGHGVLLAREDWTKRGVAWCPDAEHDITDQTTGRFYRIQEVVDGTFDPSAPRAKSEAQLDLERRIAQANEERRALSMAAVPKPAKKDKAPRAVRAKAAGKTPKACLCGCGGQTKGGRFLPGHDARYHSAQNKAKAPEAEAETTGAPEPNVAAPEAAEDLTVGAEAEAPAIAVIVG